MAKGKRATWQLLLGGCAVTVGLYIAVVLALAYGIIQGVVPEHTAGMALTLGAFISVLVGGLLYGRQLSFGVMGGCLAVMGCFWAITLLVAWGFYGGVAWSSTALALGLSSVAGAILAGVLGRKRKGRRIAKRFG